VQWDSGVEAIEAIRKAMPNSLDTVARYKCWSKEEARDKFFVKGEECVGAISYEAGSLSAYKFVIGVLKIALKLGLELFTNTPATNINKEDDGIWSVDTPKGVVKAKRVVLATNGYTGFLCKRFQGKIVPLRGQITAHRPGKNMPENGLSTTYSFIYKKGYEYMIPRPQGSKFAGDIVIGGGLAMAKNEGMEEFGTTDDTTINEDVSKYLTETTSRYFGSNWGEDHEDGRIRKEWSGVMGFSPDGFPFVGKVPGEKDLWIAASFQGHGMVLCFMCARALVAMMRGEEEKIGSWFPEVFKVSDERLKKKFVGRLHTKPLNIETKTRSSGSEGCGVGSSAWNPV
jgi:glycine/D-amino acid oxidase-like deaminating enzyme